MTFYEQIQASIDYAEKNLQSNTVSFEVAARHAMMSVSNFYRYFNALTGYSFKEYLRKRRLTNSLVELISDKSIIDIAYNNCFESHEVFTRGFKKEFKLTPSEYRKKQPHIHGLQPIKIVKETFMGVVIKNLPEMKNFIARSSIFNRMSIRPGIRYPYRINNSPKSLSSVMMILSFFCAY